MLFNSFAFLLLFLPVTFGLWRLCLHFGRGRLALFGLVAASLFFYGKWNPLFLPLLLLSISVNFVVGESILTAHDKGHVRRARFWLRAGLLFNLGLLGFFKYSYFVASNLAVVINQSLAFEPMVLPLGISFITFQKIAYLVDCHRGLTRRYSFLDYLFFVSFFPQLIAGPIVHHQQLIGQVATVTRQFRESSRYWPVAASLFSIGLAKKVCLADSLARYAGPAFVSAQAGPVDGATAWQGMLAYTLQLYFDFSGYSDMAIGLALLFGFYLPVNFDSPYRASSVVDFWRRWHMTLSTFLRDYVYFSFGGNRQGESRQALALLATMLLGGLWHGAGWTFIIWGGAHGVLLLINHGWRRLLPGRALYRPASIMLTFTCVALAWVLFRAADLASAGQIYRGLLHVHDLPSSLLASWQAAGEGFEGFLGCRPQAAWLWIALGLGIVWLCPTGWRWAGYPEKSGTPCTVPSPGRAALAGLALWLALKTMLAAPPSEFLYFNF